MAITNLVGNLHYAQSELMVGLGNVMASMRDVASFNEGSALPCMRKWGCFNLAAQLTWERLTAIGSSELPSGVLY